MALYLKKSFVFWGVLLLASLTGLPALGAIKTDECLECHDTYKGHLHGKLACVDCHVSVTSLPHPEKLPRPACITCHPKETASFSADLHNKKGFGCTECHNVHFIKKDAKRCISCHEKVTHGALPSKKNHLSSLACTACHGKTDKSAMVVRVETRDGQGVKESLIDRDGNHYISRPEWHAFSDILRTDYATSHRVSTIYTTQGDPHSVGQTPTPCRACHSPAGYFKSATLQVSGPTGFSLPIDSTIFVPELPSQQEFAKTVHGRSGVACSDCHRSKKGAPEDWSKDSTVCITCHQDIQKTYGLSTHAKKGATQCVDCHNPHRVKSYRELNADERVAVCSRCHTDYLRRHRWLPNTVLHFRYLECATCHSPQSKKGVVFYLARKKDGRNTPLSHNELTTIYGSDPVPGIMDPKNAVPPDDRIGHLFTGLAARDRSLTVDASIIVTRVHHDYSETRLEERECVTCHSGDAAFYSSMFFVLPGQESAEYLPVRGTLISAYPIGGFVDFFLLGENKIKKKDIYSILGKETAQEARYTPALAFKLIDLLGLLAVLLVLCGICVHIVVRIVVKR